MIDEDDADKDLIDEIESKITYRAFGGDEGDYAYSEVDADELCKYLARLELRLRAIEEAINGG